MTETPHEGGNERQPRTLYGVIIAKDDIVEIRHLTDDLLGIIHPLEAPTNGGVSGVSWKPANEIHMLDAATYEDAMRERDAVRGRMEGIVPLDNHTAQ